MNLPYEWVVGWRYTRAGRAGRRNRFISFISSVSILGIALGVAALIIVLSVMNGFQKEVRDRMLSVIAHVELLSPDGEALPDWQALSAQAMRRGDVVAAAPFISTQALVSRGPAMQGVVVRGIVPAEEARVTGVAARLNGAALDTLQPGAFRILLGAELARTLGVVPGDTVTVVAPGGNVTPAGLVPRLKQFTVAATFEAGHQEFDSGLAMVHLDDAARLFRTGGPVGVQLKLADVHEARATAQQLQAAFADAVTVRDWTRSNATWYDAVQVEKRLMFIILTLIVAVAAFNLVSTLVMTVTDKQADIAILRTLGASPRSIMGIFVVQGAAAGVMGTLSGAALGLAVAFHIDTVVPAIERALGTSFLPGSIYVISTMPSDPQRSDIVPTVLIALLLSFLATLYPSWRASRVQPAQALRYE